MFSSVGRIPVCDRQMDRHPRYTYASRGKNGWELNPGHFGDCLSRQSFDWCKKPLFLTNHVAGTSKTHTTTTKWQHKKLEQQLVFFLYTCHEP